MPVGQPQRLYRPASRDGSLEHRRAEHAVVTPAVGGPFREGDNGVAVAWSAHDGIDNPW